MPDPTDLGPAPFVLRPDQLTAPEADAVLDGAVVVEPHVAVLDVTGPGAVACMQGLLTADIDKPGDGAFVYGALLTPKGMIVTDLWALRERGAVRLTVPRDGLAAALEIFSRSLPPRLARYAERSPDHRVVRLAGPRALELAAAAGLAVPSEGRAGPAILGECACVVARPHHAPFAVDLVVPAAHVASLRSRLAAAGMIEAAPAALELARVLAGWPRLGAEIDGKTLPQEVRFDDLGGVSYTKGCYTGQETVARLHFRGHANRQLMGLAWDEPPDLARTEVSQDERPRGRVSSIAWVAPLERHLGLGIIRREVDRARPVVAAGAPASVLELPFALDA
ncbi:MAG: hypothetical protein OER21_07815 [Gemmatimonadota bacterium]|nr:hypothetical protein [Gemmatimonadota bacterium]